VEIEVILNFPPVSSSLETDLYRAIEKVARAEGAAVVPNVLRGFTDSHFFRNRGMTAYGFVPVVLTDDDESRMHGPDERMPLENLSNGPKRLVAILEALAETSAGNGEGGGG
jgi:acetylornithine deacetylase/succinyl-diaminopimelate desuccinylase-like protein